MKRLFTLILLLFLLPLTAAWAELETYIIDPQHSYILWHINHFGFSSASGKWMAHGTLELDKAKPQSSKVNVVIHMADVITGIPELNKKLRTKLFFNTDKYPKATFISENIILTGKKSAKIHGILTICGIAKPITLYTTLNKMGRNPLSNKMSAGFSANTQLKRSEFNINALLPGLGDEVKINIELEAYKKGV